MAHGPMEHVKDERGQWTVFTDLISGGLHIPLGPELNVFGLKFQLTKFMVLEVVAAGLIVAIFVPLARRAARGGVPTGPWWNAFEALLTFIRDEVARPNLGGHGQETHHGEGHGHGNKGHEPDRNPADKFVPFLWTVFLFILFCNLLGMIPLMGSPTASIWVTGALALCSFIMMHGVAIAKMGPVNYVKSLWPALDVPFMFGIGFVFRLVIQLLIFCIELLGTVIKSGVLAVRLFANMFAGHMVLAMILFFIVTAANAGLGKWAGITLASVLGVTALSLLELFVAFLQAYIFTFLTALFMGMALHPQH
jgi:F-type H+-transporting ATPase subunit a